MREIKFSVWDKRDKVWLDDNLWLDLWGDPTIECPQYIGKKDKHGKEIREGDYLYDECCSPDDLAYGHYGETYEVRWSNYNAGFGLAQKDSSWPKQEDGYAYSSGIEQSERLEIRGNRYENPELIGGQNESEQGVNLR